MLQYERIDVSEGIDINKSNKSKECILCHYWYFKDIGFMILDIEGVDYRCFVRDIIKRDAINMLNNSKLYYKGTLCQRSKQTNKLISGHYVMPEVMKKIKKKILGMTFINVYIQIICLTKL